MAIVEHQKFTGDTRVSVRKTKTKILTEAKRSDSPEVKLSLRTHKAWHTPLCVCLGEEGHSAFHLAVRRSFAPPPIFNGASFQQQPDTSYRKSSAPGRHNNIHIITAHHLPVAVVHMLSQSGVLLFKKKKSGCHSWHLWRLWEKYCTTKEWQNSSSRGNTQLIIHQDT